MNFLVDALSLIMNCLFSVMLLHLLSSLDLIWRSLAFRTNCFIECSALPNLVI